MRNNKINNILIIAFCFFCLTFGCAAKTQRLIVYFDPGTLEASKQDVDNAIAEMNPSENYSIEGYSCSGDQSSSNEELLAIAERRARKVKLILIEKGFPSKNLSTIAFDHADFCMVVIKN